MSIKGALRRRAADTVHFPGAYPKRAAFVLWNSSEGAANAAAEELRSELQRAGLCSAVYFDYGDSPARIQSRFAEDLLDCQRKIREAELPENTGYYILVISAEPEILRTVKEDLPRGQAMVDFVQPEDTPLNADISAYVEKSCRMWWVLPQIRDRELMSLVLQGAYAQMPLTPAYVVQSAAVALHLGEQTGQKRTMIRLKEYNAVMEKLTIRYQQQLAHQLQQTSYSEENLWTWFGLEAEIKDMLKECPRRGWLPMTGYADWERSSSADRERGQGLLGRLSRVFRHEDTSSESSAKSIQAETLLGILYGREQDVSMPEWLRARLEKVGLDQMCAAYFHHRESNTREELKRYFSLEDIYSSSLAEHLKTLSEKRKQRKEEIGGEIAEELGKTIYPSARTVDAALASLEPYFRLWMQYIRVCADELYVRKVESFVREQRDQCRSRMEGLRRAANILENCRIGFWQPVEEEKEEQILAIADTDELEDFILKDTASAQFSKGQVEALLEAADEAYLGTAEDQAVVENRPVIALLYADILDNREDGDLTAGRHFTWEKYPVDYLPQGIIWELKFNRCPIK